MTWTEVYDYIIRLAPELGDAAVGVPEERLRTFEQDWGVEIPPAYRGFLVRMGLDAGRLAPFPGQEWNFFELLRDPPEAYRPRDFLRVAVDVDPKRITWVEVYLDMASVRPDGDCEIIQVEWLEDPAVHRLPAPPQTFLEHLLGVAWLALDGRRFAHDRIVHADADALAAIHEVLAQMGFRPTLPPTPRVAIWSNHEGAPASAHSCVRHGVSVILAAEDETLVERMAQRIVDHVPGARWDASGTRSTRPRG